MCVLADNVLVLVQEEQKRAQAALQEIEAKGSLKRQTKGGKNKVWNFPLSSNTSFVIFCCM
jgi:hypothetical protein